MSKIGSILIAWSTLAAIVYGAAYFSYVLTLWTMENYVWGFALLFFIGLQVTLIGAFLRVRSNLVLPDTPSELVNSLAEILTEHHGNSAPSEFIVRKVGPQRTNVELAYVSFLSGQVAMGCSFLGEQLPESMVKSVVMVNFQNHKTLYLGQLRNMYNTLKEHGL